jgi:hypothetical protein
MNTAEKIAPSISEPLSWAEICARYPDEWVSMVELEHDPNGAKSRSGRVIGHGKTRRESLEQVHTWWKTYPVIGHFFTGKIKPPVPHFPRIVMTDEIRDLIRARR